MKGMNRFRWLWWGAFVLSSAVSCLRTDSGGQPGGDQVQISGIVSLPGGALSERLWLVAQGIDGTSYGAGETGVGGSFSLSLTVPADARRVLVGAVDPADPGRLGLSLVELEGQSDNTEDTDPLRGIKSRRMALETPVDIDAYSTAEVLITAAKNDLSAPLTAEERALAGQMADALELTGLDACSAGPSEVVGDVMQQVIPDAAAKAAAIFDGIASGDGALLDRVRSAQEAVSSSVTPCNKLEQPSPWLPVQITATKKIIDIVGVVLTRLVVKTSTSLSMFGFGKDRISEEEIGVAGEQVMGLGFGNCRENSLAAAYMATRFPELKQVAALAVVSDKYMGEHAVAIGCTADASVYDLSKYSADMDAGEGIFPGNLAEAGCIIIDPWQGHTELFTPSYVESEQWRGVGAVMVVDRPGSAPPPAEEVPDPLNQAESLSADPCTPFTIPEVTVPDTEHEQDTTQGPSGDEDLIGSCYVASSYTCVGVYGFGGADMYRQACEGQWRDGACPTQNALGACYISMAGYMAQVMVEYYDSQQEEDFATQAEEAHADCLEADGDPQIDATWEQPYGG